MVADLGGVVREGTHVAVGAAAAAADRGAQRGLILVRERVASVVEADAVMEEAPAIRIV